MFVCPKNYILLDKHRPIVHRRIGYLDNLLDVPVSFESSL